MSQEILDRASERMDATVADAQKRLSSVRTGRASIALLDRISVDYYGTPTPVNQLSKLSVPEPTMILAQPFDPSIIGEIEKAIMASDLGLNPSSDGNLIRVPIPLLTEERRKELVKHVRKMGEDGKIAVRNIRRDANEKLKAKEKNKEISQDEEKQAHDKIQAVTDSHGQAIDEMVKAKEKELMTV